MYSFCSDCNLIMIFIEELKIIHITEYYNRFFKIRRFLIYLPRFKSYKGDYKKLYSNNIANLSTYNTTTYNRISKTSLEFKIL